MNTLIKKMFKKQIFVDLRVYDKKIAFFTAFSIATPV